jgi:PST family polysaccharide transporter
MNKLKKAQELIGQNQSLISNFSYLGMLQAINLVLPLVTYPYLIRVLGLEIFGSVIFAQTVGFFAGILVNFGFNITATRRVAQLRDQPEALSRYASTIFGSKVLLWAFSLSLLLLLVFFTPKLHSDPWLYILSFGIAFNELLVPVWFFQGIEKMKYLTLVNFVSRGLSVALIFVVVNTEGDYLWVPAMIGTGALVAGIISQYLLFVTEKLKFVMPRWSDIRREMKESLPVFVSRVAGTITERANIILLGTFAGNTHVTIYDFVIKVLSLFKIPIEILVRTVYPRISLTQNSLLARRTFWLALSWGLIGGLLAILLAPWIIILVGPEQMAGLESYLLFVLPLLILMATSWSFSQPFILAFGHIKLASAISVAINVIYLIGASILVLTDKITVINCLFLLIAVESFGFCLRLFHITRLKLWKFSTADA